MVEGSYGNGDSRTDANPFGYDSFGNSLAGPGQQSQRPPRSQQAPRLSLVSLFIVLQACLDQQESCAASLRAHLD